MDDAYALIVGIADYLNVAALLSAVRNDACDVRDLLVDPRHGGYLPEHVTLLLDGEATRRASWRPGRPAARGEPASGWSSTSRVTAPG